MAHQLPAPQPERPGGFPLALLDRVDAGPDDFADIGALEEPDAGRITDQQIVARFDGDISRFKMLKGIN